MKKLVLLAAALASVSTIAATAQADETNPSIVHRQGIYKVVAGHMAGLKSGLFLKGSTENLVWDAESIVAAFQHMGDAYPEGSDKGETKAKANIWTDRAKFQEAGKKSYGAAVALVEATKAGDQAKSVEAFKALGGTCKACHEEFRKD
ncbi:MAG TPA: cytochrome c [Magnetospirillum sp.]|nr:cytochrome c [Magnetospirillum sp.]